MRIFVAGASGAIGTRLVPQLIERRHKVLATPRSPGGAERSAGRSTSTCSPGTRSRRRKSSGWPGAIVHQTTALADLSDLRHFDRTCITRTCSAPGARAR